MATIRENNGDASAGTRTTYTIALGDVFKGTLSSADDKDWIKVNLSAGTIYDFTLRGVESAELILYDSSGNRVVSGGANSFGAKLLFSPDVTGTYYVHAGSTGDVSPADYDLSLVENTIPVGSYDEIADYLSEGYREWADSTSRTFDVEPGGILTANITALTEAGQQLARWALEAWTNVTGITFEFVDHNGAHIMFDDDDSDTDSAGFAYSTVSNGIIHSSVVNVSTDTLIEYGSEIDSQSFTTYVHEIGHALGLGHPGPYNGKGFYYETDSIFLNDSEQVTVMSYWNQQVNTYIHASRALPVTAMIADIIAVQNLYGVPDNINTGDTVYGYQSNLDGYLGEFFRVWIGEADPFNSIDMTDDAGTPTIKIRLVDLDNDSDPDLVIGNNTGSLFYFENTGTSTVPEFTERTGTGNPLDGISVRSYSSPAFTDLDGDGDDDLIVGNHNSDIAYYENTGTASSPDFSRRSGTANPFDAIALDAWTTPALADLDGDGDPDLAIGTDEDGVRYYENTGTSANPRFTLRTGGADPLENIDAGSHTTPVFVDLDADNDPDLVIGNRHGDIAYFENTGTTAEPDFTQRTGLDNPFAGTNAGSFIAPEFADLEGDGNPDLIIGDIDGVIYYLKNTGTNANPGFSPQNFANPTTFTLYDNGGNDTLDLRTDTNDQFVYLRPEGISDVYGLTGNLVIARDTWIENYIGGSGNDVIVGNAVANYIKGLDGDDRIWGGASDDILEGGAGADRLDGGSDLDWVSYLDSDAAVTVNLADNTVSGGHAEGDVLVLVENAIGSAHADVLTGNEDANRLEGGAGADQLDGAGGNDWVSYRGSDAGVTVDLAAGTFEGGHAQGDAVSNIENVTGSGHADVLTGDGSANSLEGGGGDDELDGAGGADTLDGGAGDDLLYGSAGADSLEGGGGFDVLSYRHSGAGVTINLADGTSSGGYAQGDVISGIERIAGSGHADVLTGDSGSNDLYGMGGADELSGNDGDDKLQGGGGADELDGGAGVDWLLYLESNTGVTVNIGDNTVSGGHAQGDTIAGFENIAGSGHDDDLTGDNGANVLEGGAGADSLDGGGGVDWVSYQGSDQRVIVRLIQGTGEDGHAEGDVISNVENVSGSDHHDGLVGDREANYLAGNGGNDGLWGYSGDDILEGGAGADRLFAGAGVDTASYHSSDAGVSVNLGDSTAAGGHAAGDTFSDVENIAGSVHPDVLVGDDGANRLDGNDGDDELTGGAGNDSLFGDPGEDRLYGGAGDDALHGGEDGDRLFGQAGADTLDGGTGIDWASFEESDAGVSVNLADGTGTGGHAEGDEITNIENLTGSLHADVLTGDGLANTLHGLDGNDDLRGNAGDDTLVGGAGADVLAGGAGADRLHGGTGVDWASYQDSDAAVEVRLNSGTYKGGHAEGDFLIAIENVAGSDYRDNIIGDDGANHLEGGDGDDTIEGGPGADRLDGGNGMDWLVYWSSDTGIKVNLADGTAEGGHAEGDVILNIEYVLGSYHSDELTGDDGDNLLNGINGNDVLRGNGGQDVLHGGVGADRLLGGDGADTFHFEPGDGDDIVLDFTDTEDRIDLLKFSLSGFDDLTITSESNSTKIDLTDHGGGTILLQDFDINNLDATDFLF